MRLLLVGYGRSLSVCLCPICPVCLSLTLVYCGQTVMDQDETWRAGRPRPWPHCVGWGLSFPSPKGHSPQFSAHICCGQMAGWIKMPRRLCVRWGPSYPRQKGGGTPTNFRPMSMVAKRLDGSRWHFTWRWASVQATFC